MQKILIFPKDGLGEAIQIYSLCELIKQYYQTVHKEDVKVYVAEYRLGHLDILRGQKHIDDFYQYDRDDNDLSVKKLLSKVRHHLLKLSSFDRIFFSTNAASHGKSLGIIQMFLDFKSVTLIDATNQNELFSNLPNLDRYQNSLNQKLGVELAPLVPKIYPTKTSLEKAKKFIQEKNLGDFVVIGQGASSILKAIPDETAISLHATLVGKGYSVIYVDGSSIDKSLQFKNSQIRFKSRNIRDIAALISLSSMYWGGDSGLTQIAAALGINTVGLYGPTDLRYKPAGAHVFAVEKSLGCKHRESPCVVCRHKDAKEDGFGACMYWLQENDTVAAIDYFQSRLS